MAQMTSGWGPQKKTGAISITFDNLGEVAEEQLGIVPILAQDGRHLSIQILPEVLKAVKPLRTTYFVEGKNIVLYPEVVKSIRDAGHEVAVHGWAHENWAKTDPVVRQQVLKKAVTAFRDLGIDVIGFRPPGGKVDFPILRDECLSNGLIYASPYGEVGDDQVLDGFVSMPFDWHHVDAYLLHPELGNLRKMFGDSEQAFPIEYWSKIVKSVLEEIKRKKIHVTLIFHPFVLGTSARQMDILSELAQEIANDQDIWSASCSEVALWLNEQNSASS